MVIKNLTVRNFRSIVLGTFDLDEISLFVGNNDAGKSNILKALNLFFNDETDYGVSLNFQQDYCKYTPKRIKKAQEIIIELRIIPPTNYKGAREITWIKTWRKTGFVDEEIYFSDGTEFPRRSKINFWLQNLRYIYVPAIRGSSYFEILLAQLHDSLAETSEEQLKNAGDDFIAKIKINTKSLIEEAAKKLGISSQIKFPSNLQALFKTLDFSTAEGDFDISLTNRGDGIKTRHIPIILKFISDQLNRNKIKGAPNINLIWGYEEPENNLEMLASFNLANEFEEYSKSIQILITTHSPGFYSLKAKQRNKTALFRVNKLSGSQSIFNSVDDPNELHPDMGIMPLITPFVVEKTKEIDALKTQVRDYKQELAKFKGHSIFVEGSDEETIFKWILEHENVAKEIEVQKHGMGCSGVKNQLMAFSWVAGISQYKSIGIFDADKSGLAELAKVRNEKAFLEAQSKNKTKAISYKTPTHLRNVKQKIGGFPIELEEVYQPSVWTHARENKLLEKRTVSELREFIDLDSADQTLNDQINGLGLSDTEKLYVLYKIPDKHKSKIAKYAISATDVSPSSKVLPLIELFKETIIPFFKNSQ